MKTDAARICGLGKELRAELARAAAAPQSTVLVRLERGMPWPSLMRVLHELAPNSGAAFQVLHCSANSGALLRESLLAIGPGTLFLHDVPLLTTEDPALVGVRARITTLRRRPRSKRGFCANVFAESERFGPKPASFPPNLVFSTQRDSSGRPQTVSPKPGPPNQGAWISRALGGGIFFPGPQKKKTGPPFPRIL